MPAFLWHCSRLIWLDNILKSGLKAKTPEQRDTKPKGVYLSEYQFNWMWNTTREGRYRGVVLKIDASGLELTEDFHEDPSDTEYNSKRIGKDFICLSDINPERIKEVWVETEPNTFQQLAMNRRF